MQKPTINYKDYTVKLKNLQAANTRVSFVLNNPNFLGINGKVDYKLFVQDAEFLAGQTDSIDAPANSETEFFLEQDLDFAKIFGSAANLIKAVLDGQEFVKVRVAGQYALKTLWVIEETVRFDQTINIPLPTRAQVEAEFQKEIGKSLQNIDLKGIEDILKKL